MEPVKQWLRQEVYPYEVIDTMLPTVKLSAFNRHSDRILPEPTYLRHLLPFGKHKGKLIADIARSESDYLKWALGNMELEEELGRTFRMFV